VQSYARTFRCSNCNEMISEDSTQCRFCSIAIDPGVAELIAGRQERVNAACSDASFLRRAVVAMYVFWAIGILITFAYWGFLITFWVAVVLVIRWQIKYSDLLTNDPDYAKARRSKNISLLLLLGGLPLGLLTNPLLGEALARYWPERFE
jgi:hypothetical protein